MTLNLTRIAKNDETKTQWEAQAGSEFTGPRLLLGQLVYYRRKGDKQRTLDPNLAPALFTGWRLDSGWRYNDVVQVVDYDAWKNKTGHYAQPIDVPETELWVEEGPAVFPLAEARDMALKQAGAPVLPEVACKDLPFGEVLPEPVPIKTRGVYITLDRIIDFKKTPGCRACDKLDGSNHNATCRERFTVLVNERRSAEAAAEAQKREATALITTAATTAADTADISKDNGEEQPSVSSAVPSASSALAAELRVPASHQCQAGERVRASWCQISQCTSCSALPGTKDDVIKSDNKGKKNRTLSVPFQSEDAVSNIIEDAMKLYNTMQADSLLDIAALTARLSKSKIVSSHCSPLPEKENNSRVQRSLSGYGTMFEFACRQNSTMGQVHEKYGIKHYGLSKERIDLSKDDSIEQLLSQVESLPGADLWGSIPCTPWCPWQRMSISKHGAAYERKLGRRRDASIALFKKYRRVAERVLELGGRVHFEWPKENDGWVQPEILDFIVHNNLHESICSGCYFGMTDKEGKPILKDWRVITSDSRLAVSLNQCRCQHPHDFTHGIISGNLTAQTSFYPQSMCETIAASLYPGIVAGHVPAMSCLPVQSTGHCCRKQSHSDTPDGEAIYQEWVDNPTVSALIADIDALGLLEYAALGASEGPDVAAAVTRLLSRKEMMSNPAALKAVRDEAAGLESVGTWDLNSVREKEEVAEQARKTGIKVHFGQLMTIAGEKFAEMAEIYRKIKGRIVYRGDTGKDEYGAAAMYQNMSASPTSVQGLNACLAYGEIPGHTTTTADAIKAYVQALLKSKYATWIELPPELRPTWWRDNFVRPVVALIKSLYGHPESGAHWENHLHSILKDMGGVVSDEFPGNYWFEDTKLLLCVYVDDFTLAGPKEKHADFWIRLGAKVDIEPPAPLGRILGRQHDRVKLKHISDENAAMGASAEALAFNMSDYAQQCVDLYLSLPEAKKLRHAATPFAPEGSLIAADDDIQGELAGKACSMLMKNLWLGRLARPDLIKPIGDLASKVQEWTRNCDKMLYRLICYIHSTKHYKLVGVVQDKPEDLKLRLYVDADFCGDRLDSKSTNGGFLVLVGPNTWFPLAWVSKKQTCTSGSTTESEVVSLAYSLFLEALPSVSHWEVLLGREIVLEVMEDNQAAIIVVKSGWSAKLRHIKRTHKVNLNRLSEIFADEEHYQLVYTDTNEQAADIFTKALEPQKWGNALNLLGIRTDI